MNAQIYKVSLCQLTRKHFFTWWRHQMETFSALLAICAGNSPVSGEFPAQRPVTRSFVVFFDLRLNKRLSKQSWGWWFETLAHPFWRHCNVRSMMLMEMEKWSHYSDVIMNPMASQIASVSIISSTVCLWHKSKKTSELCVTGLCEGNPPLTLPSHGPVTRKMFPFDNVIMIKKQIYIFFLYQ